MDDNDKQMKVMNHAHCGTCINTRKCILRNNQSLCRIIWCSLDCGQCYHTCKQDEHDLLCSNVRTVCINVEYGCPAELLRHELGKHLQTCPASVVPCSLHWDRFATFEAKQHSLQLIPDQIIANDTEPQLDIVWGQQDKKFALENFKLQDNSGLLDSGARPSVDGAFNPHPNSMSLQSETTAKYVASSKPMIHFVCGKDFRRDEYSSHVKNVHNDIHSGLNGWLEHRCPMFNAGCKYSQRRLFPNTHESTVTHSELLGSFGISPGPPIVSPVHLTRTEHSLSLCDLPSEQLWYLCGFLDSFTLSHLAMTNTLFRGMCATRLHSRGIVTLRWDKHTANNRVSWQIKKKIWRFSVGFSPVVRWCHRPHQPHQPPMASHLLHCPLNKRLHHILPVALPYEGFTPEPDLLTRLCTTIHIPPEEREKLQALAVMSSGERKGTWRL